MFIHAQVSRAPSQAMVTWRHKHHHFQHPHLPASPLFSRLMLLPHDLGIPCGQVRVICPTCVSPAFWFSPNPLTGGAGRGIGKALALGRNKKLLESSHVFSSNPSPAPEKPLGRKLTPPSPNHSPMPISQHQGPILSVLCTQPWQ